MGKLNVDGTEIQVLQIEEDDYISLTDMPVKYGKHQCCADRRWVEPKNIFIRCKLTIKRTILIVK